ncbi:DUF732 domain-containing protein [Gordonia sp. PKS22-38]|uniref:DUF732 domain-containing protein n=1 Tax=Gordonia prachuapensis TaxID=3115651 RepID=A0ABU7MQ34_9ACTN|nr:DUF732 domain-containing protein [Gordonia sp. PKS22-38]
MRVLGCAFLVVLILGACGDQSHDAPDGAADPQVVQADTNYVRELTSQGFPIDHPPRSIYFGRQVCDMVDGGSPPERVRGFIADVVAGSPAAHPAGIDQVLLITVRHLCPQHWPSSSAPTAPR